MCPHSLEPSVASILSCQYRVDLWKHEFEASNLSVDFELHLSTC
jgi:hypothetical protein